MRPSSLSVIFAGNGRRDNATGPVCVAARAESRWRSAPVVARVRRLAVGGAHRPRMDQHTLLLAAVPLIGVLAGFIITLAGSGSLLTLPLLILLGLPANIANGTNRVGVLLQNVVAVATFRKRGALPLTGSWKLVLPSVVGAVVGAELAVDLDEELLRQTIGALMLVLLVVMLFKPERWMPSMPRRANPACSSKCRCFSRSACTAASSKSAWACSCSPVSCSAPATIWSAPTR